MPHRYMKYSPDGTLVWGGERDVRKTHLIHPASLPPFSTPTFPSSTPGGRLNSMVCVWLLATVLGGKRTSKGLGSTSESKRV